MFPVSCSSETGLLLRKSQHYDWCPVPVQPGHTVDLHHVFDALFLVLWNVRALVRELTAEGMRQLLPVTAEDPRIVRPAWDGDAGHPVVEQVFGGKLVSTWISTRSAVWPWLVIA